MATRRSGRVARHCSSRSSAPSGTIACGSTARATRWHATASPGPSPSHWSAPRPRASRRNCFVPLRNSPLGAVTHLKAAVPEEGHDLPCNCSAKAGLIRHAPEHLAFPYAAPPTGRMASAARRGSGRRGGGAAHAAVARSPPSASAESRRSPGLSGPQRPQSPRRVASWPSGRPPAPRGYRRSRTSDAGWRGRRASRPGSS